MLALRLGVAAVEQLVVVVQIQMMGLQPGRDPREGRRRGGLGRVVRETGIKLGN